MTDPPVTLNDFDWIDIGPPLAFPHTRSFRDDPARYILRPDIEFRRPWLATPQGTAFVWPMGIEGFEVTHDTTLGIHQYVGVNDVDATVVFPDQTQIVLSGTFPGLTGVDAMQELKKVLREPTPNAGKYLSLPDVLADIARVQVQNARFSHDAGDNTHSVGYSITFIRVAIGNEIDLPPLNPPGSGTQGGTGGSSPSPRILGTGVNTILTGSVGATLRATILKNVTASTASSASSMYSLLKQNEDVLTADGSRLFLSTFKPLPPGKKLAI